MTDDFAFLIKKQEYGIEKNRNYLNKKENDAYFYLKPDHIRIRHW